MGGVKTKIGCTERERKEVEIERSGEKTVGVKRERDKRRGSLIRVILLTVVLWRIGLIVVPPKAIILRRIVKNRGIILVRIITWIIWSSLLNWSS